MSVQTYKVSRCENSPWGHAGLMRLVCPDGSTRVRGVWVHLGRRLFTAHLR